MKATGIVRRIDDLGRVVIPKELRRSLKLVEGDPLEIFVDDGGIISLKKYSPGCDYCESTDTKQYGKATLCSKCASTIVSDFRDGGGA